MDSYISVYTLRRIDNLLENYKRKILKDFYKINNLSMDYNEFENKYIERPKMKIPVQNTLNEEKCHAYIYDKFRGKIQCKNKKKTDKFCLIHKTNQNYGIINF
jgi:tRNA uridine 5-carbamoylmethylation protein Kti12